MRLLSLFCTSLLAACALAAPADKATSTSSGIKRHASNAERLKRGLPPNKPARLFGEAKVVTRQTNNTVTYSARVLAKRASGEFVGYLGPANDAGEYGLTANINAAFIVAITSDGSTSTALTSSSTGTTYNHIGAINGDLNTGSNIAPSNGNYQYFGGVQQRAAGSTPANTPNTFTDARTIPATTESDIWVVDNTTFELFSKYVNTDGTVPPQSFAYDSSSNFVAIVGDFAAFQTLVSPDNVEPIQFFLEAVL